MPPDKPLLSSRISPGLGDSADPTDRSPDFSGDLSTERDHCDVPPDKILSSCRSSPGQGEAAVPPDKHLSGDYCDY